MDASRILRGYFVGREPGNDIVIGDSRVSARHARLTPIGDWLLVEDPGSSNGTFVNGRSVGVALVSPRDRVSLGSLSIDPFNLLRAKGAWPDTSGRRGFTLGRAAGNDIVLDDQRVSARHALAVPVPLGVLLVDLESSNGIWVNDVRARAVVVSEHDGVRFGSMPVDVIGLARQRSAVGHIGGQAPEGALAGPGSTPDEAPVAAEGAQPDVEIAGAARSRPVRQIPWPVFAGLAAALLLAVLLIPTYVLASKTRARLFAQFDDQLAPVAAARQGWSDAEARPTGPVRLGQAAQFQDALQRAEFPLRSTMEELASGSGQYLWFFWRRGADRSALEARFERERALAMGLEQAEAALGGGLGSAVAAAKAAADLRAMAANDTTVETDVPAFVKQAHDLREGQGPVKAARDALGALGAGTAGAFGQALVSGADHQAETEIGHLDRRAASVETTSGSLVDYKGVMAHELSDAGPIVRVQEAISSVIIPALERVHPYALSTRRIIEQLKAPLPVLGLTNLLAGGGDSSMSALEWATQGSPDVRTAVEVVEAVATGVDVTYDEAQRAHAAMGPLTGSIREFAQTQARPAMVHVTGSAAQAAEVLRSQAGTVGQVVEKVALAANGVRIVGRIAANGRHPAVAALVGGLAETAGRLVDLIAQPFRDLQGTLTGAESSLRTLLSRESDYTKQIDALRVEPPFEK